MHPAGSTESTRAPLVRVRWAALIAVGAALLGVLAFPRFGVWPLAIFSVASLCIAVNGRRSRTGAWLGLLYGLVFFGFLLHWTGIYVGPAPWLLLAAACAAYTAGLGALLPVLQRLPGGPLWVGAAWVLAEFGRSRWPFGGFPWGRLAFSQSESPLRWFAALGGAPLVSFAVATAGGALGAALVAARERRLRPAVMSAVVVAVVLLAGTVLRWPLAASDRGVPTATVAVVQGDVPDTGLEFNARRRQVLDNHVAQTLALADDVAAHRVAQPAIVLWPENSSDIDPYRNADAAQEISRAAEAVGAPILVGAILDGPGNHVRNAGVLWFPGSGPGAVYVKRHPVPFAEYIPLRGLARAVSSKTDLVPRDMAAGHGSGLLTGGPFPLGDVICFEVAYDGLVRSSVSAGAQLLVVQTNNATFGHTAETYQQLAMSRLRAVEHGRSTVQVSTSGVSAVIGADGTVLARSGALFSPARLVVTVPLHTGTTLGTRLGAISEYLLAGAAVLALAVAIGARDRLSRPHRHGRHGQPNTTTEEMVRA